MSDRVTVLKNEYGHLQYHVYKGAYFIHLELYKWSKLLFKKYQIVFEMWLLDLAEDGIDAVFVIIPDNDKKLYKFEQMFGFEEIQRNDNAILMARSTRSI